MPKADQFTISVIRLKEPVTVRYQVVTNTVDNKTLVEVNAEIRYHDVEIIGEELRSAMSGMKSL